MHLRNVRQFFPPDPPISRPARWRRFRRRWARRGLFLLSAPLLAWVAFLGAVEWWPYPRDIDHPGSSSTFIEDRNGVLLAAVVAEDQQWRVPLEETQISPHLLNAIVAVEDSRFFQHHGVDWRSAGMATWEDLRGLHIRRGASTLTMQLQRLRDPRPRTFFNKLEQAIRAEQIEQNDSKRSILIEYANRAPFGGNLVGAGAASWRYFGRPCAQLSLAEAAMLAGLPQSPNRLRPDRHPQLALVRRNHVLDRMLALGMIDARQHDEATAEPVLASWRALPQERENPIPPADGSLATLTRMAAYQGGSRVRSTIDAGVQHQVAQVAGEHLAKLASSGINAAAVVVLDTENSQCLAAASVSRSSRWVDLTRRPRSTGSTLKPFIYASAFMSGVCAPDAVLEDAPIAFAGYEPADYDRKFRGSMTAAEALAESRNIPAMMVLAKVGVEPAIGVMRAAGLSCISDAPDRYGLSLAIGGAEASPMQLAQAYAMLGRGGVPRRISFASRRDAAGHQQDWDENGRRIAAEDSAFTVQGVQEMSRWPDRLKFDAPSQRVLFRSNSAPLTPAACWQTLTALSGADRTTAVCPSATRLCVAWKTGTSTGHRDAWCAAVTRHRTVVVWLGNTRGEGSPALIGAEAAAPLALRLIASLDPRAEDPWPTIAAPPVAHEPDHKLPSTTLTLISPTNGQQFAVDPDSPRDRQRVQLKASLRTTTPWFGNDSRTLWWFVDSQPVGVGDPATQIWWPPMAGVHEIRVIDAHGHAAVARVTVR